MATTARFKLTATGDLDMSNGLQLETDQVTNVICKVRKVLLLFLGSWYQDKSKGIPWIQQILAKKNPDLRLVTNALATAIKTNVPEIGRVVNASIAFDRVARSATYSCQLVTTVGAIPFSAPLALP